MRPSPAAQPATPRSWPGRSKSPPWWASGRFLCEISSGDTVILDGGQGLLILDPDGPTVARYEAARRAQFTTSGLTAVPLKDVPPVTRDGVRIASLGNIEFPPEAAHCVDRGADGVGLYRTEFLYVNKLTDPTEAEHFDAYKAVLAAVGPDRPVVIRTLDLGADKFSSVSGLLTVEKTRFWDYAVCDSA